MTHGMLLTCDGLERITEWAQNQGNHMRILHVMHEQDWDLYVVLVDCTDSELVWVSLLE